MRHEQVRHVSILLKSAIMVSSKFGILLPCLLALLGGLSSARAQGWESHLSPPTPGPFPPPRPSQLEYTFGWNGVTAATAEFKFSKTADDQFRLEGRGQTVGFAHSLWNFEASHFSLTDARTLRPILVKETESAKGKNGETQLDFTPEGVDSRRDEHRGSSSQTKTRRFDFPNVVSLNSALLFLRSQRLADGEVQRVVVYPQTSAYLCTVTVSGRERITVPSGSYEAIKLDLHLNKIGKNRELLPHKKVKRATVWLSDDADRVILRAEVQVFVGTVFLELRSAQFDRLKP